MVAHSGFVCQEGQSSNRPSLFNGSNYGYWKKRIKIFIQASDYKMWGIIVSGLHAPTKIINNVPIPKAESEWDENDERMAQLNAKAMNLLCYSLDANEFNRILGCISTKKNWDKLEVTYEGTNQVKKTRINMLVHRYELFQIE